MIFIQIKSWDLIPSGLIMLIATYIVRLYQFKTNRPRSLMGVVEEVGIKGGRHSIITTNCGTSSTLRKASRATGKQARERKFLRDGKREEINRFLPLCAMRLAYFKKGGVP